MRSGRARPPCSVAKKIPPVATAGYSWDGHWRNEGSRCSTSGATAASRRSTRWTAANRYYSRRGRRAYGSLYDRFHEEDGVRVLRIVEGHRHRARLLDVRLNNASRLAGFARRADLPFFLEKLCGVEYIHELGLA